MRGASQITVLVLSEELVQELERKFPVGLSTAEKVSVILQEVSQHESTRSRLLAKLQAFEGAGTLSR
jgi:hypothetical protein